MVTNLRPANSPSVVQVVQEPPPPPPPVTKYVLSIDSNPRGLSFTLDGAAQVTPFSQALDTGIHAIDFPTSVAAAGLTYSFARWNDGVQGSSRTVSLTADTSLFAILRSPVGVVAGNVGSALNGLAMPTAPKFILGEFGYLMFYVDGSGRLCVAGNEGDPTAVGWTPPFRSVSTGFHRPAAVRVGVTNEDYLVLVQSGDGATGASIAEFMVRIIRDPLSFALKDVTFSGPATVDAPGRFAVLTKAHDGSVWAVWSKQISGASKLVAGHWAPATGWVLQDIAIDTVTTLEKFPAILQRQDDNALIVVANNSQSASTRNLALVKATFDSLTGAWTWRAANLTYRTDVSRGMQDAPDMFWDAFRQLAVVVHDLSGQNFYEVFGFDVNDARTDMDTPLLAIRNNEWGTAMPDDITGDYWIFFIDELVSGAIGRLVFVKRDASTGAWGPVTPIDSGTDNEAPNVIWDFDPIEIVWKKGTSLLYRRLA